MDHFQLSLLTEDDVTKVVEDAGGRRLYDDDRMRDEKNADYVFSDSVVELKLLNEEGLEKTARQEKLAALFSESQGDTPVVVLDSTLLSEPDQRLYYRALEGPIKTHVKKAAKQVDLTAKAEAKSVRCLLAINNGYTALDHNEFTQVVQKCVRNDTSRIDVLIVAGCYFYSDTFDGFFFPPIDFISINDECVFSDEQAFRESWNNFIGEKLADSIRGRVPVVDAKSPVLDLTFRVAGVTYVKPAPPMGSESKFFKNGRPRTNSTGLTSCPPVAETFPKLDLTFWNELTKLELDDPRLAGTFQNWLAYAEIVQSDEQDLLQPLVPVEINFSDFSKWNGDKQNEITFESLCQFTLEVFQVEMQKLLHSAVAIESQGILSSRSIVLRTREIGQDKANDLCSLYIRSETPGFEREDVIAENLNIFFEYGKALAAAYAIQLSAGRVVFDVDRTYCWH